MKRLRRKVTSQVPAQSHLGDCHLLLGRSLREIEEYRQAAALDPGETGRPPATLRFGSTTRVRVPMGSSIVKGSAGLLSAIGANAETCVRWRELSE
jgi:hypothetical protein